MNYITYSDLLKMDDSQKVLVNRINIINKYQHICMVSSETDDESLKILSDAAKFIYSKDRKDENCTEIEMLVSDVKKIFVKEDFYNPTALAVNIEETTEKPLYSKISTRLNI